MSNTHHHSTCVGCALLALCRPPLTEEQLKEIGRQQVSILVDSELSVLKHSRGRYQGLVDWQRCNYQAITGLIEDLTQVDGLLQFALSADQVVNLLNLLNEYDRMWVLNRLSMRFLLHPGTDYIRVIPLLSRNERNRASVLLYIR